MPKSMSVMNVASGDLRRNRTERGPVMSIAENRSSNCLWNMLSEPGRIRSRYVPATSSARTGLPSENFASRISTSHVRSSTRVTFEARPITGSSVGESTIVSPGVVRWASFRS
jgi:hypothetical protein